VVFNKMDDVLFNTYDMAANKRALEAKGVQLVGDLFQSGSVRLATFLDLSGNALQVYQHVR
jgi:hypothetical protein